MSADDPSGVVIGRVVGVFGLRGGLKVAASVFDVRPGMRLLVSGSKGTGRTVRVERVQPGRGHLRLYFEGVTSAEAAEQFRDAFLRVEHAELPALPPNAYRESELVGMRVVDSSLGYIGDVLGIAHYPGSDMLIVGPKRVLVPMLEAYGMKVDRFAREIQTTLPAGFNELA